MSKTNLIIIDDVSGSRYGQEMSDKNGIDSMIDQQRSACVQNGIQCNVTLYRFNSNLNKIHDSVPITEFPPIEMPHFSGGTALYDTIGYIIRKFSAETYDGEGKVLCIITDGLDTASYRYGQSQIKKMIDDVKQKGWQIMYLSENVETMRAGYSIGISGDPSDGSQNISTGRGQLGVTMSGRATNTALTQMLYTSSGYDPY